MRVQKGKPLPPKTKQFCVVGALLGFWLVAPSHKGKCLNDVVTSSVSEAGRLYPCHSILVKRVEWHCSFLLLLCFVSALHFCGGNERQTAAELWGSLRRSTDLIQRSSVSKLGLPEGHPGLFRKQQVDKATLCPRAEGTPSDNNIPCTVVQFGGGTRRNRNHCLSQSSWPAGSFSGTEYSSVRVTLFEKN